MTPLVIEKLSKRWQDGQIALDNISFEAAPGTLTALIGPSGGGKTTLLKIIAGLYRPDSGDIRGIQEQPVMVFQEDSLWPHLTLLENVSRPLRVLLGVTRADAAWRAEELLSQWGLADRLGAYPAELSGGQCQRGALARALVKRPKILCLDEITSGLDPETTTGILESILKVKASNTIILMATHQLNFARASADNALFLDHGHLVEQGAAGRILSEPQSSRVKRFVYSFEYVSG